MALRKPKKKPGAQAGLKKAKKKQEVHKIARSLAL